MKNTTILLITLLIVCLVLFIRIKEPYDNIDVKTELIDNIDTTKNSMTTDYKDLNNETINMENQQTIIFYMLSITTGIVVLFTVYYVVS